MEVSDVLRDRMQEPAGLQRMAVASALGHAALVAVVLVAPGRWFGAPRSAPTTVMTISLGSGTPGPRNGGMTSIGGRAVQEQAPPEPAKVREPVQQPAAKTPEMTVPKPRSTPIKRANTAPVKQAPEQAVGRTPSRGPQPTPGTALVDTGVRGQGFGLSTGGGRGSGSSIDFDVASFCCPDYLIQMQEQIRSNWNDVAEQPGDVVVKFTIQRSGMIDPASIAVEKRSGSVANDLAARRAVALTGQLVPLPSGFPNPTLTVHLDFNYSK